MDEDSRSFTQAEFKFFSCDTGGVPVIVVFTKFDALYDVEYAQLRSDEDLSWEDAQELAPKRAEESFANGPQLKFLYNVEDIGRPPKCHVCLPNMDKDGADCGPLIERTAETLDDETLEQLFVSTQQMNLELCMKYAVEVTLAELVESAQTIPPRISAGHVDEIGKLRAWFPHIDTGGEFHADNREEVVNAVRHDLDVRYGVWLLGNEADTHPVYKQMQPSLHSLASGSSTLEQIVQLCSATVIILECSFHIWDQRRSLEDWNGSEDCVRIAVDQYMRSPHAAAVRDAVGTAIHTYQENSSIEGSQKTAELVKTILEVTLQHRLPRS